MRHWLTGLWMVFSCHLKVFTYTWWEAPGFVCYGANKLFFSSSLGPPRLCTPLSGLSEIMPLVLGSHPFVLNSFSWPHTFYLIWLMLETLSPLLLWEPTAGWKSWLLTGTNIVQRAQVWTVPKARFTPLHLHFPVFSCMFLKYVFICCAATEVFGAEKHMLLHKKKSTLLQGTGHLNAQVWTDPIARKKRVILVLCIVGWRATHCKPYRCEQGLKRYQRCLWGTHYGVPCWARV